MNFFIKLLIVTIAIFSYELHCCAMQKEDTPEGFHFLYNDPNMQDKDGNTILHTITGSLSYYDIKLLLKFFLSNPHLNLNLHNKKQHTALFGLFFVVNNYDSTAPYLECIRCYLNHESANIKDQQKSINDGFSELIGTWPYQEDAPSDSNRPDVFFNLPVMEYTLSYVNDLTVLNQAINILKDRIAQEPQNHVVLNSFLEKVIAQKNEVEAHGS